MYREGLVEMDEKPFNRIPWPLRKRQLKCVYELDDGSARRSRLLFLKHKVSFRLCTRTRKCFERIELMRFTLTFVVIPESTWITNYRLSFTSQRYHRLLSIASVSAYHRSRCYNIRVNFTHDITLGVRTIFDRPTGTHYYLEFLESDKIIILYPTSVRRTELLR